MHDIGVLQVQLYTGPVCGFAFKGVYVCMYMYEVCAV